LFYQFPFFQSTPKPSAVSVAATAPAVCREDRRRLEEAVLCSLTDNLPSPDNLPVADTPPSSAVAPSTDLIILETGSRDSSRPVSRLSDETLPHPPSPPPVTSDAALIPEDSNGPQPETNGSRPESEAESAPTVAADLTSSLTDPPTPLNDEKPSPGNAEATTPAPTSRAVIFIIFFLFSSIQLPSTSPLQSLQINFFPPLNVADPHQKNADAGPGKNLDADADADSCPY
jgi:hypothetical protein